MKNLYLKILIIAIGLGLFSVIKINASDNISVRLKGKILLQVEDHGEAWYVNPDNLQKYYLGRPDKALSVVAGLGLGISNKDFDGFNNTAPSRLAGKILLKVEDFGEAYYVNPVDLKKYYLGRPADIFNVMQKFGLGISNKNLDTIITASGHGIPSAVGKTVPSEEKINEIMPLPATSTIESGNGEIKTETGNTSGNVVENISETATSSDSQNMSQETPALSTSTCIFAAEYFDNKKLIGAPAATATEETIDHDWGFSSTAFITIPNNFSARWTTNCYFPAGRYRFTAIFDDAINIYVDDINFMRRWSDGGRVTTLISERNMAAGEHEVKVEYYEYSGNAQVKVFWEKLD